MVLVANYSQPLLQSRTWDVFIAVGIVSVLIQVAGEMVAETQLGIFRRLGQGARLLSGLSCTPWRHHTRSAAGASVPQSLRIVEPGYKPISSMQVGYRRCLGGVIWRSTTYTRKARKGGVRFRIWTLTRRHGLPILSVYMAHLNI